jgi:hypothetical protein
MKATIRTVASNWRCVTDKDQIRATFEGKLEIDGKPVVVAKKDPQSLARQIFNLFRTKKTGTENPLSFRMDTAPYARLTKLGETMCHSRRSPA